MSTYINFQIQIKTQDGTWLNRLNSTYSQNILREIFNINGFGDYPVVEKGFPEDFRFTENYEAQYIYGKTWYSREELYDFLDVAKQNFLKKIKEIEENNKYTLFKGLLNKESFEDIKSEFKELDEDDDEYYVLKELEALEGLIGAVNFVSASENSEIRLVVWYE